MWPGLPKVLKIQIDRNAHAMLFVATVRLCMLQIYITLINMPSINNILH